MTNTFIVAGIISIVYFLVKFTEMRFVDKESKPLKLLIRDSLLVYFSVIASDFIIGQINPIMNGIKGGSNATPIFTDNPGF